MKILVGLGNPGKQYENTRHNVGFMILDAFANEKKLTWTLNKKFQAEIIKDGDLILVKPQTFMNNSGISVQAILNYYKTVASPETLTVIHDDLDIDFGKYKISTDSRSAGHNGVQSIIDSLGTKNFKRIRIGIKQTQTEEEETKKIPVINYVLRKFKKEETKIIEKITPEIINEISLTLR